MNSTIPYIGQDSVRVVIPSRIEMSAVLDVLAEEWADKVGLSVEEKNAVAIAVSEAVDNAIKHGNGLDPARQVTIEFSVYEDRLIISVSDQGEGFDPQSVANPLEPRNLLKENGRGLFIVRNLMDEVHFFIGKKGDKGTRLEMVKYLSSP